MRPDTQKWVERAEGDFATANRELRTRKSSNYEAACFHAQQCAEKYLKARLIENGNVPPRTHNLLLLLDLTEVLEPLWEPFRSDLSGLNAFAVSIRYPESSADKAMAREALKLLKPFRRAVREALGLGVEQNM